MAIGGVSSVTNRPGLQEVEDLFREHHALVYPDLRSMFAAIEEDLGLRLEPATEKLELLVIERVERPSEN
jgi:uncharacterized protein (TIGR03435 family)